VADCVAENVGVFTITFEGGREVGKQRSASGTASVDSDWVGTYQVTRDRVTIKEPDGGSGTYTQTFSWSQAANRDLTLTPVPRPSVGHYGLWWLFIHPLTAVD
jgi:hypothetical protein